MTAPNRAAAIALWVLAGLAVVMFLRAASELLIPVTVAVLLSYAFDPVVARLERLHVPRYAGAGLLLLVVVGGAAWGLYTLRDEVTEAVNALPQAVARAGQLLGIDDAAEQAQQAARSPAFLGRGVSWLLYAAGHVTVVVFLTYFLLISGQHFKRRFVELAGPRLKQRRIAVDVLDDINEQIQRFLLVRLVTSAIVALATWAALAAMDVRQAAVWGILSGIFNSIPYFGPVIVSGGLLVVGFLQFGEPVAALKIAGVALAITSLEGWLLEPPLLGRAERMHVLVVFLGVLVWTWLWGEWGTILAVPMLVVVKSICDHVEPLAPVSRLLAP
jgi:predicted PurR-regulated permease PerM